MAEGVHTNVLSGPSSVMSAKRHKKVRWRADDGVILKVVGLDPWSPLEPRLVNKLGDLHSPQVRSDQIILYRLIRHLYCSLRSSTQENLSSDFENNKGADHTVHLRSLISANVICLMDII